MISYSPFWQTLKKKNVSTYTLIHQHKISSSTLNRLRHNRPVTTVTLNDLCRILNCPLAEVAQYEASEEDSLL